MKYQCTTHVIISIKPSLFQPLNSALKSLAIVHLHSYRADFKVGSIIILTTPPARQCF